MRECNGKHHGFNTARTVLASMIAVLGYASSGPSQAMAEPSATPNRVVEPVEKKTVSVTRFDTHGPMLAQDGDDEMRDALAAQLVSELEGSGRFIVLKPPEFSNEMHELELALSGLTDAQSSPQAARLLGAEFLVRGSVTGTDETDGIDVSIDLRVIDTTTGRVVASFAAQRKLSRSSASIDGVGRNDTRLDPGASERSTLGRAAREAIAEAVLEMGRELDDAPWNAQVTKVRAGQVYLNAGANAKLDEGDQLDVYRLVDHIEDPDTGEVLGVEERHIGTVTLGSVQPCFATGSFSGPSNPRVGDNLR